MRNKTIIFIGDGMADEPIRSLDNKTPLQVAKTPAMDSIARNGCCGTLLTLPEGFPTSSDVANMSVLGCDLPTEFCGRGPLEAAGQNISIGPQDIVFRLNLTTVVDGILTDFAGGHLSQQDAKTLISALNQKLADEHIRFFPGVSYRNLLVLSGDSFSPDVKTEKPDDNQGNPVAQHQPQATSTAGQSTAARLNSLISNATDILTNHPINKNAIAQGRPPANSIWPNGGGQPKPIRTLYDRYKIKSAVISAVDVINGIGQFLGMDIIQVPGTTGYIDSNFEGKADAAIKALQTHDLVYLHVEAIDDVSHAQNLDLKIKTIEEFDSRVVARVLNAIDSEVTTVILPDHPVPVSTGKHTRTPVPLAINKPHTTSDNIQFFDELSCPKGALGAMKNRDMMLHLFS